MRDPCKPSPCGPFSRCRNQNQAASCECLPDYIGSPPSCQPECLFNSQCSSDMACIDQKCGDPCLKAQCGERAKCRVLNHSPLCSCPPPLIGDPFYRCQNPPPKPKPDLSHPRSPCDPFPGGDNADCEDRNGVCVCQCRKGYLGQVPFCRPECSIDQDCAFHQACRSLKCKDVCEGSCGINARCEPVNHRSQCLCNDGYTGDPYSYCTLIPGILRRTS